MLIKPNAPAELIAQSAEYKKFLKVTAMNDDDDPIAKDEALDYIVYKEVTGQGDRSKSGCLSMVIVVLLPVGSLVGWAVSLLVK